MNSFDDLPGSGVLKVFDDGGLALQLVLEFSAVFLQPVDLALKIDNFLLKLLRRHQINL
ncbi:hypothetical protein [Chlorobium sp.]|uniref:hypothetical protein n=1 Tax=Chlorobium sp. TaxID=1095 RepID=UPI003C519B36